MPRGSGASGLVFARRLQPLSRADKAPTGFGVLISWISAQKPAAPMTYTDLLGLVAYLSNVLIATPVLAEIAGPNTTASPWFSEGSNVLNSDPRNDSK